MLGQKQICWKAKNIKVYCLVQLKPHDRVCTIILKIELIIMPLSTWLSLKHNFLFYYVKPVPPNQIPLQFRQNMLHH